MNDQRNTFSAKPLNKAVLMLLKITEI